MTVPSIKAVAGGSVLLGAKSQVLATDPLSCRQCGSSKWSFTSEKETGFDLNTGQITHTTSRVRLRCAKCNRQATIANFSAISDTDLYVRITKGD
jgi:hypothetical protein